MGSQTLNKMEHISVDRAHLREAVRLAQDQDISDHWTATHGFSLAISNCQTKAMSRCPVPTTKLKHWVAVQTILYSSNIVGIMYRQLSSMAYFRTNVCMVMTFCRALQAPSSRCPPPRRSTGTSWPSPWARRR